MVPGKFKDEVPNKIIFEFVGLRAKMYSILFKNHSSESAVYGVSRVVATQLLPHEMFKKCLMENFEMTHKMVKIGHQHHKLQTQTSMKKSLSPLNDKKLNEKF